MNRCDIEALLYNTLVVGTDKKRMLKRENLPSTVQKDSEDEDDLYLSVGDGWKPPPPAVVLPPGGQVLPYNLLDFFTRMSFRNGRKEVNVEIRFFFVSHSLHCIAAFKVNFCNDSFGVYFWVFSFQRWRVVSLEKKWHSRDDLSQSLNSALEMTLFSCFVFFISKY